jgi:hypothetical protein
MQGLGGHRKHFPDAAHAQARANPPLHAPTAAPGDPPPPRSVAAPPPRPATTRPAPSPIARTLAANVSPEPAGWARELYTALAPLREAQAQAWHQNELSDARPRRVERIEAARIQPPGFLAQYTPLNVTTRAPVVPPGSVSELRPAAERPADASGTAPKSMAAPIAQTSAAVAGTLADVLDQPAPADFTNADRNIQGLLKLGLVALALYAGYQLILKPLLKQKEREAVPSWAGSSPVPVVFDRSVSTGNDWLDRNLGQGKYAGRKP